MSVTRSDHQPDQAVGFGHRDPVEAMGDHAMGLELQLVEVVEQIKRASAQERWDDVLALRAEEGRLEAELARTAAEVAAQAQE